MAAIPYYYVGPNNGVVTAAGTGGASAGGTAPGPNGGYPTILSYNPYNTNPLTALVSNLTGFLTVVSTSTQYNLADPNASDDRRHHDMKSFEIKKKPLYQPRSV